MSERAFAKVIKNSQEFTKTDVWNHIKFEGVSIIVWLFILSEICPILHHNSTELTVFSGSVQVEERFAEYECQLCCLGFPMLVWHFFPMMNVFSFKLFRYWKPCSSLKYLGRLWYASTQHLKNILNIDIVV